VESSRGAISVGDTAIVSIKINADKAVLNTIDGEVSLKSTTKSFSVKEFSLANSSFGLWPRTPSLSQDGSTISFVTGVPGGFSIEGATLFKIIVQATKQGSITINPQNISLYANDGAGTKVPVQFKPVTITIGPKQAGVPETNDWLSLVSGDVTPPEPFIIVLGQDQSVFGGKKFAYFSSIDNQSGIDHYEVSENGGAYVRSGSTYELQNQASNVQLSVLAYDKAGNKRLASYPAKSSSTSPLKSAVVIVIGAGLAWALYRLVLSRKKHA
jgi:hypothetical protein